MQEKDDYKSILNDAIKHMDKTFPKDVSTKKRRKLLRIIIIIAGIVFFSLGCYIGDLLYKIWF